MPSSSKNQAPGIQGLLGTGRGKKLKSKNNVPEEMSEALASFDAAKLAREAYRQEHAAVIDHWQRLNDKVEDSYGKAKEAFSAHRGVLGNSYGGFVVVETRGVDADLLVTLMPDAIALVSHRITLKDFDKHVRNGTVSDEIAQQVVGVVSEKINGPER